MSGVIASLAITAGTTAFSFAQANAQKKIQNQANLDADKALIEARSRLSINFAEGMSIQKEPYEKERLAMLAAGAQATAAAAEGETRGSAAAAGQTLAGQQEVQSDITDRQTIDMQNIENAILEEDSRLRDLNVQLDTQELAGQQQAAADARFNASMATQQGIQGVASLASQGVAQISLYSKDKAARQAQKTAEQAAIDAANKNMVTTTDVANPLSQSQSVLSYNVSDLSKLTTDQITQYYRDLYDFSLSGSKYLKQ